MSKVEEFLSHADRCDQLCNLSLTPSNREALRSAAATWRRLAREEASGPYPIAFPPRWRS